MRRGWISSFLLHPDSFEAMSTADYRCGYLYTPLYERLCQNPDDHEVEQVLEQRVERWHDLTPKQCERLRFNGNVSLAYTR